jgi:hypothetical protein
MIMILVTDWDTDENETKTKLDKDNEKGGRKGTTGTIVEQQLWEGMTLG